MPCRTQGVQNQITRQPGLIGSWEATGSPYTTVAKAMVSTPMVFAARSSQLLASFYRCLSISSVLPSVEIIRASLNKEGYHMSLEEARLLLESVDGSRQRVSHSATVVECINRLRRSTTKGGTRLSTALQAGGVPQVYSCATHWESQVLPRVHACPVQVRHRCRHPRAAHQRQTPGCPHQPARAQTNTQTASYRRGAA